MAFSASPAQVQLGEDLATKSFGERNLQVFRCASLTLRGPSLRPPEVHWERDPELTPMLARTCKN